MSALSDISMVLSMGAVVCAITAMLVPQNRMKKMMNLVLSLFLICSLILPVKELIAGIDLGFAVEEYEEPFEEDGSFEQAVMKECADRLVLTANELLQNEGITARDIRLSLKKSDSGSISVKSIVIYIDSRDIYQRSNIESIIYRNFSKEPKIIIYEESYQSAVSESEGS